MLTRLASAAATGLAVSSLMVGAWAQDGRIDPTWSTPLTNRFAQLLPTPGGQLFVVTPFDSGAIKAGAPVIQRLLPDGSPDPAFASPLVVTAGTYLSATLQADGKVLLWGGHFTPPDNSQPVLLRLQADGRVDASFDAGVAWGSNLAGGGPLAVNAEGDIFLAGTFPQFQGVTVAKPIRLTPDGKLDPSFNTGTNPELVCSAIADAGERRVYAAQIRNDLNPIPYSLVRLLADGSRDGTFPGVVTDNIVHQIHVLSGGRLVLAGAFNEVNGVRAPLVAWVNADGTVLGPQLLQGNGPFDLTLADVFSDGSLLLDPQLQWLIRVRPDGTEDREWGSLPDGSRPMLRAIAASVGPGDHVFANYMGETWDSPSFTHRLTALGGPARPQIVVQPKAYTVVQAGERVELTVEAIGDGPFTYRWSGQDGWIGAASANPVMVVPAATFHDGGWHYVLVSGPGGSTVSQRVVVGIVAPVRALIRRDEELLARVGTLPGRPLVVEFRSDWERSEWEAVLVLPGLGQQAEVQLPLHGAAGFYRMVSR